MKRLAVQTLLWPWLAWMLAGCGGGGATGVAPEAKDQAQSVPTVLRGVYRGTLNGKEFLSVITPERDWYALYFESLAFGNPDIFSGKLSPGVDGQASIASVRVYQIDKSAQPLTGSASITAASALGFGVSLSGITSAQGDALIFSAVAPASTSYDPASVASDAALQGRWMGTWYDGHSSNKSALHLAFDRSVISVTALNNCDLSSLALTPISGVNLFSVALHIPEATLCTRTRGHTGGVDLSGVAFLSKSPLAGASWRLDLIAVDEAGSGISFHSDP